MGSLSFLPRSSILDSILSRSATFNISNISSTIHAIFDGNSSPEILVNMRLMIPTLFGIYDAAELRFNVVL